MHSYYSETVGIKSLIHENCQLSGFFTWDMILQRRRLGQFFISFSCEQLDVSYAQQSSWYKKDKSYTTTLVPKIHNIFVLDELLNENATVH